MQQCERTITLMAQTPLDALRKAPAFGTEHPTMAGMVAVAMRGKRNTSLVHWWKPWTWRRGVRWDVVVTYQYPLRPLKRLSAAQMKRLRDDYERLNTGFPEQDVSISPFRPQCPCGDNKESP